MNIFKKLFDHEYKELKKFNELAGSIMALDESYQKLSDEELKKAAKRQKIFKVIRLIVIYLFLIFVAFIMIFPFYWMINSSLKSMDEYYLANPTFWPM